MAYYSYDNQRKGNYNKHTSAGNQSIEQQKILALFRDEWITIGIDDAGVDFCSQTAQYLQKQRMSASYVRNIFGELKRIETRGFEKNRIDFYMLRPKVAYATARAKERNMDMSLLYEVYKKMTPCVCDARTFKNMVNMIEAIIAFHKAFGGKE